MPKYLKIPIAIFLFFTLIAISMFYLANNIFFLFNFLYMGSFASVGVYLFLTGNKYGRSAVQWE